MVADLKSKLDEFVWGRQLAQYGLPGRIVAAILRYIYAVLRDVFAGQLTLRAMSLVYTTLLSVVPLLALTFSVLKGLGVAEQLEDQLALALEPLGEQGRQITDRVMDAVDRVNFGVLGSIGLAFFIYTAIAMVQKVESSFNYVWYVSKPRSFAKRFTEYSLVLLLGPLLMVIALGILTSLQNEELVQYLVSNEIVGPVAVLFSKATPYLIIIGVFTALYMFLPNTKVNFGAALVGGLTSGVLWATASLVFTAFVVGSESRDKVYAAFAVAIVTLIWLYLNWLILLIGSQVAFYFQNPEYLRIGRREPRLSNSMRERIALETMVTVGREFREPGDGIRTETLGAAMKIPTLTLAPIIDDLEEAGLLSMTEDECLQPGRDLGRIRLRDILAVVRAHGETGALRGPEWEPAVESLAGDIDAAVHDVVGDTTLAELLDSDEK
jgi:membrane protein